MQNIQEHTIAVEFKEPGARTTVYRKVSYPPDQFTAPEWGMMLRAMQEWHAANYNISIYPSPLWWRLHFTNNIHGPRSYWLLGLVAPEVIELRERLQREGDRIGEIYEDGQLVFRAQV